MLMNKTYNLVTFFRNERVCYQRQHALVGIYTN